LLPGLEMAPYYHALDADTELSGPCTARKTAEHAQGVVGLQLDG